ncbi:MAG: hypothetical protein K2N90_11815, partial [Lachnospiraceae bacterium]|nr:hypothetical protein [Lachnospiraceae bacterium]
INTMGKITLKKVVFCEIAWMKYYNGISEDDKPMNGGKYIKENGEGGEIFNFTPYNHKCYGYVMHYGNELHIERYDKALEKSTELDDLTVIWVASDGESSKIVGWYENATMYRYWQMLWYDGQGYDYNFIADEKDCYLIDADKRTFVIPRAPIAGAGRGMGQSQVWYADSDYAQDEFIPKVMKYLDSVRDTDMCKPFYYLPQELEMRAEDKGQTTEQLLAEAAANFQEGLVLEAMGLVNLAQDKDDCYDTRCLKATFLDQLFWYDEAEEEYKQALYHEENIDAMIWLMEIEVLLNHTFLAIELGEKIRKRKAETSIWAGVANNLAHLYIGEGAFDKAQDLINECEQENAPDTHNWITNAKENMEAYRKEIQAK